jgi:hypothetical protein
MPTHLGFDKPSLTIDSLAAQRLGGWRSPLDFPFASMLLSPFPFRIRLGCALTTSVPVVLTLDQQGDEEHNGAQCACLLLVDGNLVLHCSTEKNSYEERGE